MTFFNLLWVAYWAGLVFLAAIAGILRVCGHRGKGFRAFLVAPAAGFIVFWLTLGIYLLLAPVPIIPAHQEPDDDLLAMLYAVWSFIFDRLAPSISYKLGLYFDPIIYGTISIPIAFIASFYFPCRAIVLTSTPAAAVAVAKHPASASEDGKSETGS